MYEPKSIYVKLALDTIKKYINNEKIVKKDNLEEELKIKRACFVSIHRKNGDLRGCIGTILPYRDNLYDEIIKNSISASTKDPRFYPIKKEELEDLEISVDILSEPEKIKDISELDCKKYGIIVSKNGRRGLLLPDLEGVDTVREQIDIAKSKAGIYDEEGMEIYKFTSTRYY